MKYAVALLLVTISMASASVIGVVSPAVVPGATIKGPSATATVVGPDGSSVASAAEGGVVVAGGVVAPAAVVAAPHVVAAPATVVAGPSGIIATNPWGVGVGVPAAAIVAPRWGHNLWW